MSGKEAANFYGLSRSAFQKARREGRIPPPTLPGKRYDRILLEMEMNRLSGIVEYESNPLDEWRKSNGSN
jgi:predicted site-specific integrase-resolvase